VLNHHAPDATQEFYTLSGIVHTADILVRALDIGNGGDDKIPIMSDVVLERPWVGKPRAPIGLRGH